VSNLKLFTAFVLKTKIKLLFSPKLELRAKVKRQFFIKIEFQVGFLLESSITIIWSLIS